MRRLMNRMHLKTRASHWLMTGAVLVAAACPVSALPRGFEPAGESGGIVGYVYEPNGLTVLLKEDHSAPVVTFMVTYKVGSRFEAPGTTGATHLLEHLMFKGSPEHNKKDGTDASALLDRVGARSNASTWTDRTNYFANLPSEHLEMQIEIEADRMRNAWLREEDRQTEMTVVRNEYERGENNPLQALYKEIWSAAFVAHPYGVPTIGWRSDIEQVPIEKLRAFRDVYYWPNNAVATVVGDFEPEHALDLIRDYFGKLKASPDPIPTVYTEEPPQLGPRRVVVERFGQLGIVGIAFKAPRGAEDDARALDVLQSILSDGKTSRFYRNLTDTSLTTDNFVSFPLFHDPGLFSIYSFLAPGSDHQKVEDAILNVLDDIRENGVTEEEVNRAISKIAANTAFGRDGPLAVARELNEWIAMGDWTFYGKFLDRVREVTPADVQRVVQTYLTRKTSTTGWFVPQEPNQMGASGEREQLDLAFRKLPGAEYHHPPGAAAQSGSTVGPLEQASFGKSSDAGVLYADRIVRSEVDGIDVYSLKTGLEDVVTIRGSLPAGDVFNPEDNSALAGLVAAMLDQGTKSHGKFEIAERLEEVGASISFSVSEFRTDFSATCLKKDLPLVLELLAEQLREPAFLPEELEKLKIQEAGMLQRAREDVEYRAEERLRQLLFPSTHPNFVQGLDAKMSHIEKTTVDDLRGFHRTVYGPKGMIIVGVGDIESSLLRNEVEKAFSGWEGGVNIRPNEIAPHLNAGADEWVVLPDKPSFDVRWGITTGITRTNPDYLPLAIGTSVLGGSFSARLMSTVRDEEGLTYGIHAYTDGDRLTDGFWQIEATFAPELLPRGVDSTERELKKWVDEGITREELEIQKDMQSGVFKVALSTSEGMAGQLLSFLERGYGPERMDEHPKLVQAVKLDQVNDAIRKYIILDDIVVVKAGTPQEEEQ